MKINKYTLAFLFVVVIGSLGYLLMIQFQILEKDIKSNQSVVEFAIPGILSDLYDDMMFNEDLHSFTDNYVGTDSFQFTNESSPSDPLQRLLKDRLEEVISLKYPDLDYKIDGFISNEFGCMIHRGHRPELPKAKVVIEADNHMCFCMILDNTLDISMTYNNIEATAIGNSKDILKTSFILILVIVAAFWYTIYTIRRQKRLSDLKRDFINNLTHEFKTPIFSISLAAKSLKEQNKIRPSEKVNTYIDLISNESKRLQAQVDKILQMALIDSGNITLEKKNINLHESIESVAQRFKVIIEEKGGKIEFNLNASKQWINADETHLNNIIFNLIDNAQKYTEGKPEIKIETRDAEDGILLIIRDHGKGMDKVTQKFVFEQFYRAQTGDIHNVKGFGLGLSYVKKIVEIHKGDIWLKSEIGKGSEFSIYLPVV